MVRVKIDLEQKTHIDTNRIRTIEIDWSYSNKAEGFSKLEVKASQYLIDNIGMLIKEFNQLNQDGKIWLSK